ncbi:hypothetical protein [Streptomyces sp. NPDC006691]|uniref:hypothetical protein n=1 Tax=Streptomyces sp. NPDC006691 TaxID=3364757 RepID=UPI0036AF8412
MAEDARISRPTVYADLRSMGIDPDHRPTGNNAITISPLGIEGFTGVGETLDVEYDTALRRWAAQHPALDPRGPEGHTEGMRLVAMMDTVARYSDVRDRVAQEQVARAELDRLLHQIELRWEALSTTAAWLAAHHAYVLAVDEARIAIDMWSERAEAALRRPFFCHSPGTRPPAARPTRPGTPRWSRRWPTSTRPTNAACRWPPRLCTSPSPPTDRKSAQHEGARNQVKWLRAPFDRTARHRTRGNAPAREPSYDGPRGGGAARSRSHSGRPPAAHSSRIRRSTRCSLCDLASGGHFDEKRPFVASTTTSPRAAAGRAVQHEQVGGDDRRAPVTVPAVLALDHPSLHFNRSSGQCLW